MSPLQMYWSKIKNKINIVIKQWKWTEIKKKKWSTENLTNYLSTVSMDIYLVIWHVLSAFSLWHGKQKQYTKLYQLSEPLQYNKLWGWRGSGGEHTWRKNKRLNLELGPADKNRQGFVEAFVSTILCSLCPDPTHVSNIQSYKIDRLMWIL